MRTTYRLRRLTVGIVTISLAVCACGSTPGPTGPGPALSTNPPASPLPASATPTAMASSTIAWLIPSATQSPRKAAVVVVGDASGRELRRVPLPHEPMQLYETWASQTVLIQGMDTWMVTNLATGATKTLDFGGTSPLDIHPLVLSGRWWVLGVNSGTPAYLLDTQTGAFQNFASLGVKSLIAPTFGPGETALEAYTPDLTLVRTGVPAVARPVGGGKAGGLAFSPDGTRLVYTVREGATTRVVTESLDGSDSHEVLTAGGVLRPEFAQDANHLLVVDAKGISLVDVATGTATLVSSAATIDTITRITWSVGHAQAIVGYKDASAMQQWVLVNPAAGTAGVLTELAGFQPVALGDPGTVQIFTDTDSLAKPANFKVLDFAAGVVRPVTGMDPAAGYFPGTARVVGTHVVATTMITTTSRMQVWLIDGSTGSAAKLEEGVSAQGAISPDGAAAIASRYDAKLFSLDLFDTASGTKASLGIGYSGVWLAP
jgi:hypothetical protein